MSQSMRDALQDGIALLGTALASIGSAGYLPDSITMIGAGGGGLALIAMLEKAWRNNKDEIIDESVQEEFKDASESDVPEEINDVEESRDNKVLAAEENDTATSWNTEQISAVDETAASLSANEDNIATSETEEVCREKTKEVEIDHNVETSEKSNNENNSETDD